MEKIVRVGNDAGHGYSMEEVKGFSEYINEALGGDGELQGRLPIDVHSDTDIFVKCADGVILGKLINTVEPLIAPDRLAVRSGGGAASVFQEHERVGLVLEAARRLGCTVVNVGPADFARRTPYLMLGIIWQIIRKRALSGVSVLRHPQLAMIDPAMGQMAPEHILLRWFNYHLERSGSPRRVTNFSSDIADAQCYVLLLNQLAPQTCGLQALQMPDPRARAEAMLQSAATVGCRKYLTPDAVVSGQEKLNLLFTANLFNTFAQWESQKAMQQGQLDAQQVQRAQQEAFAKLQAEQDALRQRLANEEAEWREKRAREEAEFRANLDALERQHRERLEEEARLHQEALLRNQQQMLAQQQQHQAMMQQYQQQQAQAEEAARRAWYEAQQYQQQMAYQQYMSYQMPQTAQQTVSTVTTTTTTRQEVVSGPKLLLLVREARGLPKLGLLAKPNPHCTIQLGNGRWGTRMEKSTTEPTWNQEFELNEFLPTDQLVIQVWTGKAARCEEFLGEVILKRNDISDGKRCWFPLTARAGQSDKVSGEIFLGFVVKK